MPNFNWQFFSGCTLIVACKNCFNLDEVPFIHKRKLVFADFTAWEGRFTNQPWAGSNPNKSSGGCPNKKGQIFGKMRTAFARPRVPMQGDECESSKIKKNTYGCDQPIQKITSIHRRQCHSNSLIQSR